MVVDAREAMVEGKKTCCSVTVVGRAMGGQLVVVLADHGEAGNE